jgi:hypothetical protein
MTTTCKNPKVQTSDYNFLVETIAKFLDESSSGNLAVMIANKPEDGLGSGEDKIE